MDGFQSVFVYWLMLMTAVPGAIMLAECRARAWKIAAIVWIVIWAAPPLVRLWIVGVAGV
jgi:hypothetical protein